MQRSDSEILGVETMSSGGSAFNWERLSQPGSTVDAMLDRIAAAQAEDMNNRIAQRCAAISNSGTRLAMGVRLYVKRAEEEPQWGRLVASFGFREGAQRSLLKGSVATDLSKAIAEGSLAVRKDQLGDALALLSGAVIGAVARVVNDGADAEKTGTHAAIFVLKAFGMSAERAEQVASSSLPDL